MAKALGVHKNTYGRLERGVREVGVDVLAALTRMGWNANWLLTGEGPDHLDGLVSRSTLESQPVGLDAARLDRAVRIVDLTLDLLGVRIGSEPYAKVLVLVYGRLAPGGVLQSECGIDHLNRFVLEKLNQIGGLDYAAARPGDRREPGQGGA